LIGIAQRVAFLLQAFLDFVQIRDDFLLIRI
jgi:hypothetical protein